MVREVVPIFALAAFVVLVFGMAGVTFGVNMLMLGAALIALELVFPWRPWHRA